MAVSEVGIRLSVSGDAQVKGALAGAEKSLGNVQSAAADASQSMRNLAGAFAGAAAGAVSIGAFIKAADAVTTLNNQLKLATGSAEAAATAYTSLFEIAQRSRVSFTELGSTFAAISRAGQELGLSQQRLLGVTEAIGNAMTISGGSAESMKAALVQLSQGLASGTLRGEELNSVMEQTPRLAKALADGLGIPIGKLRELGQAGELTAEKVIYALRSQQLVLASEIEKSTVTVGQAMQQLQNSVTVAVGDMDKASGATNAVATALQSISTTIGELRIAFGDLSASKDDFSAFGDAIGFVMRAITAGAYTATVGIQQFGLSVAGVAAAGVALASGNLAGAKQSLIAAGQDIDQLGQKWLARATDIVNSSGAIKRAAAEVALNQSTAETNRLSAYGESVAQASAANKKLADSYEEIRVRLSGFKGDYAKYQADLKTIQELRGKGLITEKQSVEMLTELAKKHSEAGKKTKEHADALADTAKAYAKWMEKIQHATNESEAETSRYTKTQKTMLDLFSSQEFAKMPDAWKAEIVAKAEAQIATEQLTEAEKSRIKVLEEATKATAQYYDALQKELGALEANVEKLKLEGEQIGLSKEEMLKLTLARMDDAIATEEQTLAMLTLHEAASEEIKLIERRIALMRQERSLTANNSAKQTTADVAKDAAKEWEKTSDKINDTLTDALMRGFESGKDFAKNMRDTVVNMFKTMVLRPVISAIVNPVAGALTGALGLAGNANASTGGIGNITNLFSGGGDMLGSIGSTVFGNSAAYGAALGTTSFGAGSQAAMLAAQTGEFGLAGLTATSGAAGGAMASIGAAIPWIGGALAIASLLKGFDDSGTIHTGGLAQYSAAGGTQTSTQHGAFGMGFGGVDYGQAGTALASGMAQTIVGILDTTATAFGKTAGYTAATAFADDTSKDGAWGGLLIKNAAGQTAVNWNDTRTSRWAPREFADGEAGAKEYAAAVAKDVRNLLIDQTPEWADTMLNALGDAPTLDQLAGTVGQINQVQMALVSMGKASEAFAGMAESATSALLAAMGGAQAATAKLGSYYTNFYTESERTALATQSLKVEMAAFGKEMPATREAFKGLVDTAIAAGDTTLAANLINVADKFAAIVPAAEDASVALEKQAAAMSKAAEDAAKAAEDAMKTARSNALRQLEASVARESALWQKQADAASSLRDEVGAVFDALASSIVDLRRIGSGNVASAVRGNQFIQDAIENSQAGLGLPSITDLNNAIQDAKSGLGMEQFSTVADQKFAALKLAGELDALKGVAGEQLTGAERQLRVAEEQLALLQETSDYWRTLLDGTQAGIDATLSVADAVRALQSLMESSITGQSSTKNASATQTTKSGGFVIGGGSGSGPAGPASTNYGALSALGNTYYGAMGTEIADATYIDRFDSINSFVNTLDWSAGNAAASAAALSDAAQQYGVSANEIAIATGYNLADVQAMLPDIPKFANGGMHSGGIRLVGERGWEVEATGPARYWNQEQLGQAMSGGTQNYAELVAELRALRAQVDDLNRHSRRTAEAINGNPEAPIPMVAA